VKGEGGREIFVFGSNLAGVHGAGAALAARKRHGAIYGRGQGLQGNSYAIPTKGWDMKPLSLGRIQGEVSDFLDYAYAHPELTFRVTRVGCGLAGYTDAEIAPFFVGASINVKLSASWRKILNSEADQAPNAML
jgi:hypothetical protein